MAALCEELDDIGPFHVFRPYNDLRFAKDRPPYKTHQGAYCESEGGAGYYFHIGADGLLAGVGYYRWPRTSWSGSAPPSTTTRRAPRWSGSPPAWSRRATRSAPWTS